MKRYRKFIVALIGVALMAVKEFSGMELGVTADQLYTLGVAVLTAAGVYQVPNEA